MAINATYNLYVICLHPEFGHKLGAGSDPSTTMSTAQQEAASYAMNNPDLMMAAAKAAI
jgi:hypothetical protein